MRQFFYLFAADLYAIKGWFSKQTFSRIFVLLGFLIVFSFVSYGLYFFSFNFFNMLGLYRMYGFLTATYLLHASIIMLLFLIFAASLASNLAFLLNRNRQMDYLLSLPIPSVSIVTWLFIRSSFLNLILLFIVFFPICFAFARVFLESQIFFFIFRFTFVLVSLVVITNAASSIFGQIAALKVKGKGILYAIFSVLIFILAGIFILKVIFPKQLFMFHRAEAEQFLSIYYSLPLSNHFLPTYWFTNYISDSNFLYGLYTAFLTISFALFSIYFQSKRFLCLTQSLKIHAEILSSKKIKSLDKKISKTKWPIMYKDFLSIIRLPSEAGYGFFLIAIGVFFFSLFSIANNVRIEKDMWQKQFIIFSFIWLLFFTTSYLLRLVFPLMAREGKNAWYIFSLPLKRDKILFSKITLGLIFSLPFIVLSVLVWILLPFGSGHIIELSIISIYSVFILALTQGSLGAIFPNFSMSESPEKISTSMMGIASLFVSIFITAVNSFVIYKLIDGTMPVVNGFIIITIFGILLTLPLFLSARFYSNRYEF
ncbi:MAG: hypothetical protein Q7K55_02110 [Candidatus Levybacteria bacterium]|nr:hypothetical protein [Candidatus Levybacteria bacterium]